MSKGHKPAGGIASKNIVAKPVRTGMGGRGVNKNWASQIGQALGDHATEGGGKLLRGNRADPYRPPNFQPVKLGNEVALNVGKGGCGTGRTIYRTGSQSTHGSVESGSPRPNPRRDALEGK